jgi:ABC-type sugar transport system substrate-binding protein
MEEQIVSTKFNRLAVTALVTVLMGLGVAACGDDDNGGDSGSSATTPSTTAATSGGGGISVEPKKIGLVLITGASESIQEYEKVYNKLTEALGWETIKVDAQGDPVKLTKGVESIATQNPDGVVLVAVDQAQIRPQLVKFEQAGIPVCAATDGGSEEANKLFSVVSGEDQYEFGKTLGSHIAATVENPQIVLLANPQNFAGQDRERGLMDGLKDNPNSKVVFRSVVDFADPAGSAAKGSQAGLSKYPDANVIVPIFDFSLPPAVKTIEQTKSDAKVFGFYFNSVTAPLIRKGADSPLAAVADDNTPMLSGPCLTQLLAKFEQDAEIEKYPLKLPDQPVEMIYNIISTDNVDDIVPAGKTLQYETDEMADPWIAQWEKDYAGE